MSKKKSKAHKQWKRDRNHIIEQKSKPIKDRIMGNVKEQCYTCGCAGYYIKEEWIDSDIKGIMILDREWIPWCWSRMHKGKICNVNLNKWYDKENQKIRQKKYEEHLENLKNHKKEKEDNC